MVPRPPLDARQEVGLPSDSVVTVSPTMFVARLICSDPACAEELEYDAPTLRELEVLVCDCGCSLEVIAWPDAVEDVGPSAAVVSLAAYRARRAAGLDSFRPSPTGSPAAA